ncbi:unnamed protein product [Leptosia nina]|uniref:PWWP domain-containing protein n=1 Tax=Leptosia nina TaxID=320188 RepID=A0AAV1J1F4_9NEOP
MCDQAEVVYSDGDIVWVKLGSCWWPGEVVGSEKLPPNVLASFRKPPIAVVKFFQEDTFEYVKNPNAIYKYECSRKNEFIQKGLYMYRTKHGLLEKFPEDVIRAETAVGGDIEILTRDEFQETKKESYADLFGSPRKKTPASAKKGKSHKGRSPEFSKLSTPIRKIKEKTNYKVHILVQGSKTPQQVEETTPSTSRASSEPTDEKLQEKNIEPSKENLSCTTPTVTSPGIYACHACQFSTSRLNVLILHNKTHSSTFTPYVPTPFKKKSVKINKTPKSITSTPKSKKGRKPRQEKQELLLDKQGQKREAEENNEREVKKAKTDEEIKSSLLADWDDGDEDSVEESSTIANASSPDVPVAAGSPAVPTPAELPVAQSSNEPEAKDRESKKDESIPSEKSEPSNDAKYEFCEDEDWPVEADMGRKIPRVKPLKRKEDTKSLSIDENEMAKEVAELLNKTTVPELPSAPEPLKVEENFPEPSIVKSPDKKSEKFASDSPEKKKDTEVQSTRTIFKTKTFFRSRHSRSQDAIGKYVAEQLNAAERLDLIDNDLNGSDTTPSPEPRISSPTEHVKVARLAPKIQLKKMNAEAAQLREKERCESEKLNCEKVNNNKLEIVPEQKLSPKITNQNESDKTKQITEFPMESSEKEPLLDITPPQRTVEETNPVITFTTAIEDSTNIQETTAEQVSILIEQGSNVSIKPNSKQDINKSYDSCMSESTASAVDALLSVSRETDRVTKVISSDPPEDLFEDDNKDIVLASETNGCEENPNGFVNNSEVNRTEDHAIASDNTTNEALPRVVENEKVILENILNDSVKTNPVVGNETLILNKQNTPLDSIHVNTEDSDYYKDETTPICDAKQEDNVLQILPSNIPTESDLQIAEALINLPSTTIQNKVSGDSQDQLALPNNDPEQTNQITMNIDALANNTSEQDINDQESITNTDVLTNNIRFESEEEKSENLNAAQSLVQMSESVDHKINITEVKSPNKGELASTTYSSLKTDVALDKKPNSKPISNLEKIVKSDDLNGNLPKIETSSKLLKILEEPCTSKVSITSTVVHKKVIVPNRDKILNLEVNKPTIKPKQPAKQKIIIRRTTPQKTLLNNLNEATTPEKIYLSRNTKPLDDGTSMQSYTIQTTPDIQTNKNTFVIQQKLRKVPKPAHKIQKPKILTSTVPTILNNKIGKEAAKPNETIFDINSMPIVISDDILTPESIEKMPIVMSDGNVITSTATNKVKIKKGNTSEKITVTSSNKQDISGISTHVHDGNKVTTPNILSKSPKLKSPKPMLIIDKATGKQKLIMPKCDSPIKEIKPSPKLAVSQNSPKTEKFVILPSPASPRPTRTQKIVIDPQTGKAHVVVEKGMVTTPVTDNKPVSAKLIPSASDTKAPGNTVMIITNAQGTQSRIVLTPEHEKILFPNKQQQNVPQLKAAHRISTNVTSQQKSVVTSVATVKTPTKIVAKQQKSAIITSKGQLIVGGRLATTTQNIAPLPDIRATKKLIPAEPKKLAPAIQKSTPEQLLFLQKPGTVMLTAAQFEHLQRTGQIIQKVPIPAQENKIVIQKTITKTATEGVKPTPKQRARKQQTESSAPSKKVKQDVTIAPAPALTRAPMSPSALNVTVTATATVSSSIVSATSSYTDMENFEELLPTTTISRTRDAEATPHEQSGQVSQTPAAPLSDGQLLAVPGEHFGGPQGSFYLCVEENGTFTPIDNRPLVLENNQLVPMPESLPVIAPQPERRDILEAALANSDVFHAESTRDEAPDFRDLNANVSVHCSVSETSTTLNQPIMTPVEVPSKGDSEPAVPSNLEDGLAVIGVTPHSVPTSLELPITVTDPRIAPKTTDPLSNSNYRTSLLPSPSTMTFVVTEETGAPIVGPISMPLLTEEESVGKSMPILMDEITERTVSSVESAVGSPSSIDVRESETEDGSQWPRRLLTPGSDISEASVEIPLQPAIQLSVSDISYNGS